MNNTTLSLLNKQKYSSSPEVEAICQFLINYGDTELSPTGAAKKFIYSITSGNNTHELLYNIAQTPLCLKVITKLHSAVLKKNDPLLKDLHYILAELYYHCKDYHNALIYYAKNNFNSFNNKKISLDTLQTCLMSTNNFHSEE